MTEYFVDDKGNYLGGFDGVAPPKDSIKIPFAPENASMIWDGERFIDANVVPMTVSNGQAREALLNAGLLGQVGSAIEAIYDISMRERAEIAWQYRPTVERNSPFVILLAQALQLTNSQLDQLFIDAAKL